MTIHTEEYPIQYRFSILFLVTSLTKTNSSPGHCRFCGSYVGAFDFIGDANLKLPHEASPPSTSNCSYSTPTSSGAVRLSSFETTAANMASPRNTGSSAGQSSAALLLAKQFKQIQTDKDIPGISCGLVGSNVFEWEVMLMLSEDQDSLYGGE